jgi:hypothetical protein
MGVLGNVVLLAIMAAAMVRSFTLMFRFLQHGIAYLRHGRMVMDWAMPIQGVAVAVVAAVVSIAVVRIDPAYPGGAGVLPLSILGAAGAMGLLIPVVFLMQRSEMLISIEYHQPLFLRDRTPGCRSTRHVTVYVGGPAHCDTRHRGVVHLR